MNTKKKRERKREIKPNNLIDSRDYNKISNVYVFGFPGGKEQEVRTEELFGEIWLKFSQMLQKT